MSRDGAMDIDDLGTSIKIPASGRGQHDNISPGIHIFWEHFMIISIHDILLIDMNPNQFQGFLAHILPERDLNPWINYDQYSYVICFPPNQTDNTCLSATLISPLWPRLVDLFLHLFGGDGGDRNKRVGEAYDPSPAILPERGRRYVL